MEGGGSLGPGTCSSRFFIHSLISVTSWVYGIRFPSLLRSSLQNSLHWEHPAAPGPSLRVHTGDLGTWIFPEILCWAP